MSCHPETHVIPIMPGYQIEARLVDGGLRYYPQCWMWLTNSWVDLPITTVRPTLRYARNVIARATGREEV